MKSKAIEQDIHEPPHEPLVEAVFGHFEPVRKRLNARPFVKALTRSRVVIAPVLVAFVGTYFLFFAGASPQQVELEGTISIVAGPHDEAKAAQADKSTELQRKYSHSDHYTLHTTDGKRIPLVFKSEPNISAGAKVKIKGHVSSTPDEGDTVLGTATASAAAAGGSYPAYVTTDYINPVNVTDIQPVLGIRNIAVVKVNFSNIAYGGTGTTNDADIKTAFFDGTKSANAFMQENSAGRVSLAGNILSVTIPNSNQESGSSADFGCNYIKWTIAAFDALKAQGIGVTGNTQNYPNALITVDGYQHTAFLFPNTPICSFPGLGEVAAPNSWYNGTVSAYDVIHEVGHNFGLKHANGLSCTNGKTLVQIGAPQNCTEYEYRDQFDPLGGYYTHSTIQYDVIHKEHLGWVYTGNVKDINSTGVYRIYRPEFGTPEVTSLRFPKRGTDSYYYLETRRPYGFDAGFLTSEYSSKEVLKGVTIRLAKRADSPTQLLRAEPSTNKSNDYNWFNAPITAPATGATDVYTDSDAGLNIKYVVKTDRYTDVIVSFTQPPIGTATSSPVSKNFVSAAPNGILKPLNLHKVNDCGNREYMTAVDPLSALPSMLQNYTDTIGKAYDAPISGAVPLYSYKTSTVASSTCTHTAYMFNTDNAATKSASYDTRKWEKDDQVAWLFTSQITASVPLYHWACPQLTNNVADLSRSPLIDYYHTDANWLLVNYTAASSCSRETLGYVYPTSYVTPPPSGPFSNGFENGALSPFSSTSDNGNQTLFKPSNVSPISGGFSATTNLPANSVHSNLIITKNLTAAGTVSFKWYCSGNVVYSHMSFYLDGTETRLINGCSFGVAGTGGTYNAAVPAGKHTFKWVAFNEGISVDPETAQIDDVNITNTDSVNYPEPVAPTPSYFYGFESGSIAPFTTSNDTSGGALWSAVNNSAHTGAYTAETNLSGTAPVQHSKISLTQNLTANGTLSFYWACNANSLYAHFYLYVDGASSTQLVANGCHGYQGGIVSVPLTAGTHVLAWDAFNDTSGTGVSPPEMQVRLDDVAITY